MPEQPTFTVSAVDWSDVAYQLAAGATKWIAESKAGNGAIAHVAETAGVLQNLAFDLGVDTAMTAGELLHKIEGLLLPILAAFVAPTVSGLFGAEVNEDLFARRIAKGGGHAAGQGIVAGFMQAIEGGGGGELAPSPEGAARIASAAVAAALEGIFNGLATEMVSDLLPAGFGHFEGVTELPEEILRTLGVSRLVRRAIGPLVNVCCTTPMQWHVNKKYRPALLSPGDAVRQVLRGQWSKEKGLEELARQGYSSERAEALFNAAGKTFSVADVRTFEYRNHWTQDQALQHLRDQGYTETQASDALRLEGLRRFEQLEGQEANAIIGAYAARDIDDAAFETMLGAAVSVEAERHLLRELAAVRRAVNVKRLTLGQVEAMVKSGVLAVIDYRAAAVREGYADDDVIALELQLRYEMDRSRKLEEHRAELEASRAEEKAARAAALAERKAAIEQERALHARGAETDLERAAVRGKIPLARLEEVYRAHYDADTVSILLSLVEDDRLAYVAQQQAREDALKRAGRRNIDVGALEQAVLTHVLDLTAFRARLGALGFSDADADLLTATLQARQAELVDAQRKRDAATAAAKVKHIDLAKYEQLVRRGVRSLGQYTALLASLGFEEAARADLAELLQLEMADDAKARALREAAEARLHARGLSLEQLRRAVLIGAATEDDFNRFLVQNSFTADAQTVLMAELRNDVAEADAARRRRKIEPLGPQAPGIALSTIRRAAQLGVIDPEVYAARLQRDGYTDDDIAIEMDLLAFERAEAEAKRAPREQTPGAASARGLSLADVERAVKQGVRTLDDYRSQAVALGYSLADASTLADVLAQELATLTAARKRHDEIAFELAPRGLSLKDLEASVAAGTVTVEDYVAQLEAWGYGADEGELLAGLLALTSEQKGGAA